MSKNRRIIELVSNGNVWGGGEQYVLDLSKGLRRRGYEVTVVVSADGDDVARRYADAGLEVERLGLKGAADLSTSLGLARLLRSTRESVTIHANNFITAVNAVVARRLSRRKDVRVVVTRHLAKRGKADLYHTMLYRAVDRMVFVSQFARDRFMAGKPKVDLERTTVVLNAVDRREAAGPSKRGGGPAMIMTHGRLSDEKGIDTVIQALARLKDRQWRLKIAGKGDADYTRRLEQLAADLGIADRIGWLGHRTDIERVMEDVAIGVAASRVPEAGSLALLDYMAAGIPVVSTDSGSQREVIEDGFNGLVVSPDAPEALAQAIGRLLDDETARRAMAEAALERHRRQLSYDRFLDRMCSLLG